MNYVIIKGVLVLKKKLLFIIVPLLLIAGTVFGAYYYVNSKIYVPTEPNGIFDSKEEKKEAEIEEEKGTINVLLVGLDGRDKDEGSRTDSIILATADTNNKRIKLTSFMRDMYVPIPGHGQNRINSAYAIGGSDLLTKTINQDFGLGIQYYMSIDFRAFQQLVEQVGGIDLEVKDHEVKEINKFIQEVNGKDSTLLKGPGYQHLNGQQALSYSRIRKVGRDDYERTERQRRVISLLIEKARKTSPLKFPQMVSTLLPYIKTNIPTTKLMSMAYTVYKFGNTPIETMRLPADGAFESMDVNGMSVLVPNMQKNADLLSKFLFSSGGSYASNMPAYMANDFHSKDLPVDKRGQKKPGVKVELPKPKPEKQKPKQDPNPKPTTPVTPSPSPEPKPEPKPPVTPVTPPPVTPDPPPNPAPSPNPGS